MRKYYVPRTFLAESEKMSNEINVYIEIALYKQYVTYD